MHVMCQDIEPTSPHFAIRRQISFNHEYDTCLGITQLYLQLQPKLLYLIPKMKAKSLGVAEFIRNFPLLPTNANIEPSNLAL